MTAIFTGLGAGLERGSANILGGAGQIGGGALGRAGENVSVNAATGNLIINRRDEFLTGRGLDAAVSRTYNSLIDAHDGDNGDQWQQSTHRRIFGIAGQQNQAGSTIKRQGADGSVITYTWDGAQSAYVTTDGSGAFDTIQKIGSNWVWRDGATKVKETYAASGSNNWRIISQRDSDGYGLTFSYLGDGKLDKVTTANGEWIKYHYENGNLRRLETGYKDGSTNKTLSRVWYSYDGQNRLESVTTDLTPRDSSGSDGDVYIVNYSYVGTTKRIAAIGQTDGAHTAMVYDASGRITKLTQTVAGGDTRITQLAYGSGSTTVTHPDGTTNNLYYDSDHQLKQINFVGPQSGDPVTTNYFTYDADGNVTSVRDQNGKTTRSTFDDRGQRTSATDPLGRTIVYQYDEQGNLVRESELFSDLTAHPAEYLTQSSNGSPEAASALHSDWVLQNGVATQATNGYIWAGITAKSVITAQTGHTYTVSAEVKVDGGSYDPAQGSPFALGFITLDSGYGRVDHKANWPDPASVSSTFLDNGWVRFDYTYKATSADTYLRPHFYRRPSLGGNGTLSIRNFSLSSGNDENTLARNWDRFADITSKPTANLSHGATGAAHEVSSVGGYWTFANGIASKSTANQGGGIGTKELFVPETGKSYKISADVKIDGGSYDSSLGSPFAIGFMTHDENFERVSHVGNWPSGAQYLDQGWVRVEYTYTAKAADKFLRPHFYQRHSLGGNGTISIRNFTAEPPQDVAVGRELEQTRFVYDSENHLRYRINGGGEVTEFEYDSYGQLIRTIEFPEHPYPTGIEIPSEAQMNSWVNGLGDRSSLKITRYDHDQRGNEIWMIDYGYASSTGGTSGAESYTRKNHTYDQAGQLLRSNYDGEIGETFVYDGMGRLIASTDGAGETTNIVFQDAQTKTVISNTLGAVTTNTYNKAGELISQTISGSYDHTGISSYKYDKMGRLRMETDETGVEQYYLYDKLGRKIADVNENGDIVEYRYDRTGRITATASFMYGVSSTNRTTLKNPNNTLQIANIRPGSHADDIWSWNVYDAKGRVIQTINGEGGVSRLEYDNADRLVKTTTYYNKLSTTQIEGFKSAAPSSMVLPSANSRDTVARVFYDRAGRVVGSLDGEGYLTVNRYDEAGQKVQEIAYAKRTSSSLWNSGTFSQLRSSASPSSSANRRMHYVYDGRVLRYQIDYEGRATSFKYNRAGKVTETIVYAAPINTSDTKFESVKAKIAAVANSANDRKSTNVYNNRGQVSYSTDPAGLRTTYTYDVRGQVTKTVVGTDANARTTRHWYSSQGLLRYTLDAEGYVMKYDYDKAGRFEREVYWDNKVSASDTTTLNTIDSVAHASGTWVATSYTYDNVGRRSSVSNGEGDKTALKYHRSGLLIHEEQGDGTVDENQSITVYHNDGTVKYQSYGRGTPERADTFYYYDGNGNVTSVKDPNGKTTTYTYDKRGLVLTETNAEGGVTRYEYNAFGEVVKTTDPRGNSTYTYYDNLGRVTKTRDAENYITETTYTEFGEIETVTTRYNRTTSAVSTVTPPTVASNSRDATTSFEYDKRGLVTKSTDAEGHFETYTYDAYGNRITARAKSATTSKVAGGTTTYAYDKRGLLTSETLPVPSYNSSGSVVASTVTNTYAYDSRGNLTTKVEASGLAEARTTQYIYDKANRLVETIGQTFIGKTPREYIYYDARGNVTETKDAGGGRTIFFYDDLNRKVVEINALGTYTKYTYDKNGNVTEVRVFDNTVSLPTSGGASGEAPGAPSGGSRVTTFTYDNINRMEASSVAGATTGYWNGSTWVSSTSALVTEYEYDANGNVVKLTDPNGNTVWSYYDKLGRKTAQVDGERYRTDWTYNEEGNVTQERRYVNKAASPTSTTTPPSVSANGNLDRVTDFWYDKNGNRTHERRLNVHVHNGSGGTTAVTSSIVYLYNGLGQVTRKTEATGDQTNYKYDAGGRLIEEKRATFASHSGNATPEVDYYYNGVGDLSRTVAAGQSGVSARVTTYGYDGDKLRYMTDAEGFTRSFWYDNAGRLTQEYYTRLKSDGTQAASRDGVLTVFDLLGRATQKYQATFNGSVWSDSGPRAVTTYNAHGDVTSVAVGGRTQTENKYDAAGRVWATTNGDGVWKYLGYDKNGNQTIAISSAGYNLGYRSFNSAKSLISRSDVNGTYTEYDKRNQGTKVTEEGRQFGGSAQTLTTHRTYNAFGEVLSETNANGAKVEYVYNNMGRVIKSVNPLVQITKEDGSTQSIKPTEHFYYDASGRLVASRDANGTYTSGGNKHEHTGNLTKLTLLAGTGYGGTQALVTHETYEDDGVKQTKYDIHGDARTMIDQLGRTTTQSFDRMGRVTQVNHAHGLVENFAYDGLGQQIKKWNNLLVVGAFYDPYTGASSSGTPEIATTDYDTQGRIIHQKDFGGDVTTHTFTWDTNLSTGSVGTFGGWTEVTTYANGKTLTEKTDFFDRMISKNDLGNHSTTYTYDIAGRLETSLRGGLTTTFNYFNTGQHSSIVTASATAGQANTNWTRETASYTYDKIGQRLTEHLRQEDATYTPGQTIWYNPYEPDFIPPSYTVANHVVKNASVTYDNLGRIGTWTEAGSSISPAANTAYKYDAAGNIRRTTATYKNLDANGSATSNITKDYWFRYDEMNRLIIDRGVQTGNTIERSHSGGGKEILYNKAGERVAVLTTTFIAGTYSTYTGYLPGTFYETRESYTYDLGGRLTQIDVSNGTTVAETAAGSGIPAGTIPSAPVNGTRRSAFVYDSMGRQLTQTDYESNGTTVAYSRQATYNSKNQLTSDTTNTKRHTDIFKSVTTYNYGAGTSYALGSVVSQTSINYKNNNSSQAANTSTTNNFFWREGAVQASIVHNPNTSGSTTNTTSFVYDALGRLTRANIGGYHAQTVTFTNDENGQIIRRDETTTSTSTGAPHEVWYRYGGRQLGYVGNNGTADVSTATSINQRQITPPTTPGVFRHGLTVGSSYADFAGSYDPLNSYNQGAGGGSYTVNQGDTLQSIAHSIYGDANLWYKIAQLNGISGNVPLTEGQRINLPTGVVRSAHNSGTVTPYNPGEAIGDLTPTTTAPPKKGNKCGVFGQILLVVIAVAVTAVTAGKGAPLGAKIAAAALGSVVSQGVGVATGIQDKFSFKGVALAALSAGVTGGLGKLGTLHKGLSKVGDFFARGGVTSAVVRGATASAISQGIGVATGLQSKFSFAGVVAAGVSAGVGEFVGNKLGIEGLDTENGRSLGNIAAHAFTGAARGIANAATRSAINGDSFGDNFRAAIPDVIGQTIGDLISGSIIDSRRDAEATRISKSEELDEDLRGNKVVEKYARLFLDNNLSANKIGKILSFAPNQRLIRTEIHMDVNSDVDHAELQPAAYRTDGQFLIAQNQAANAASGVSQLADIEREFQVPDDRIKNFSYYGTELQMTSSEYRLWRSLGVIDRAYYLWTGQEAMDWSTEQFQRQIDDLPLGADVTQFLNDGHADALRHAYWAGLLTLRFGPEFAYNITTAHERVPLNESPREAMDLFNNSVGISVAQDVLSLAAVSPSGGEDFEGTLGLTLMRTLASGGLVVIDPALQLQWSDKVRVGGHGNGDDARPARGPANHPLRWPGGNK